MRVDNDVLVLPKEKGRPIVIQILSDNHMIRAGLRTIFEAQPDMAVVADGSTGVRALELAIREHPNVILLDLELSGVDVSGFIRELQDVAEYSLVLLLGSLGDEEITREALNSGAAGIVLKTQPPAVLIAAIRSLCSDSAQSEP